MSQEYFFVLFVEKVFVCILNVCINAHPSILLPYIELKLVLYIGPFISRLTFKKRLPVLEIHDLHCPSMLFCD